MAIKCCYGCVAPKRYPGCHSHCPEYIEEKAKDEAAKAAYMKRAAVDRAIADQRGRAVRRAMKDRRKGKYYEQ